MSKRGSSRAFSVPGWLEGVFFGTAPSWVRDRFRRLHIEPLENRRLLTSLSGFVYNDVNGDGVMETGGAGIRNAAITLTGTDDILGGVTMTALTSSSGAYSFNLGSGNYKLTVHDPAGYVGGVAVVGSQNIGFTGYDTYSLANDLYIDQIMLEPGADGTDNNFGELSAAVVSGTVWNDSANNDGVKQAGEPVLSGVTVQLSGSDDRANDVETSAKTNAQGAYAFASLRPGTYKLTVGQPTGYIPGKVIAGSEPTVVASPPTLVGGQGQIQFSVDPGNIGTGNNFAELRPASLSGYVWDDTANNNGVKQTGEPGIAGVKLTLTGISDLGAITSVSAVTDTSGAYCFTNLRPGTYTLTETQPPGYTDGKEGIGTPGGTIGIGQFTNIVLAAGVSGANNNFGEIKSAIASQLVITMQPSPTAKAGTAFAVQPVIIEEDQYGNVISGDSEHTVTVTLDSLGTASVRGTTTVTFVNGVAAFSGLFYNKAETMNLVFSTNATGVSSVTSNSLVISPAAAKTLAFVQQPVDTRVFVTIAPAVTVAIQDQFGNTVTSDSNDSVTVAISTNPASGTLGGTKTVTVASGVASFSGLSIDKVGPGYALAAISGSLSSTTSSVFSVGSPASSSLSGYVYIDASNRGQRMISPGVYHIGVPGVTVTLVQTDAHAPNQTVVTDINGYYHFDPLPAGTFMLVETQPQRYLNGKDEAGNLGGNMSVDNVINQIVLPAGQQGTAYNFGEWRLAADYLSKQVALASSPTTQAIVAQQIPNTPPVVRLGRTSTADYTNSLVSGSILGHPSKQLALASTTTTVTDPPATVTASQIRGAAISAASTSHVTTSVSSKLTSSSLADRVLASIHHWLGR